MTMSVGLGRIANDPNATPMTRRALGILSTPGLLVTDTSITINDSGQIAIKLKPDGGLMESDDGLYMEIRVGLDSNVDISTAQDARQWNIQATGTAPNFIQSTLFVGVRGLTARSAALEALGYSVEPARVVVQSNGTQLRLHWDERSFYSTRVLKGGGVEHWSVGADTGFHFIAGDGTGPADANLGNTSGVMINYGSMITQVFKIKTQIVFAGGGTAGFVSWQEFLTSFPLYTARNDRDHVTVVPLNGTAIPGEWIAWNAYITASGQLALRLTWLGVAPADTRDWAFVVTKFRNVDT